MLTDLQELILLKNENKAYIPAPFAAKAQRSANNPKEIIEALPEQSIYLWLSDSRFKRLGANIALSHTEKPLQTPVSCLHMDTFGALIPPMVLIKGLVGDGYPKLFPTIILITIEIVR